MNPVISGPAHSSPARHKRLQPGAALHLYPFGVQKRPSVESPPECEEIWHLHSLAVLKFPYGK